MFFERQNQAFPFINQRRKGSFIDHLLIRIFYKIRIFTGPGDNIQLCPVLDFRSINLRVMLYNLFGLIFSLSVDPDSVELDIRKVSYIQTTLEMTYINQ